jgi:biotin transport system permease protein
MRGSIGAGLQRWLQAADPRLKILLAVAWGVLAWQVGGRGLLCYLGLLAVLSLSLLGLGEVRGRALLAGALLVAVWTLAKTGLELLSGTAGVWPAAAEGMLLGGRLLFLVLLGLCLAAATSPRSLGLGINSFIRPLAGKRSWQGALSLALMLHFLPYALRTLRQARLAVILRKDRLSWWSGYKLLPQTVMRVLGQKTWEQTVALAARGLDRPEAWDHRLPFRAPEWALGLAVLCLLTAALLL